MLSLVSLSTMSVISKMSGSDLEPLEPPLPDDLDDESVKIGEPISFAEELARDIDVGEARILWGLGIGVALTLFCIGVCSWSTRFGSGPVLINTLVFTEREVGLLDFMPGSCVTGRQDTFTAQIKNRKN